VIQRGTSKRSKHTQNQKREQQIAQNSDMKTCIEMPRSKSTDDINAISTLQWYMHFRSGGGGAVSSDIGYAPPEMSYSL